MVSRPGSLRTKSKFENSPASFVKVMTLFVIYDAIRAGQLKMDDLVTVSEMAWRRAWKTEGSKMFIRLERE